MVDLLEACFTGMNIVPTSLMGLTLAYWAFVLSGTIGLDLFDFDLDLDLDGDVDVDVDADVDVPSGQLGSMMSLGVVVLRFLNIGSVPVMLWFSIFSLALWAFTMMLDTIFDDPAHHENVVQGLLVLVRNGFFALLSAKAITQPLRGKFDPIEPTKPEDLIGQTCVITTTEVTDTFGQARHEMAAAPLLLNVRSTDTSLTKEDLAVITGFDPHQQTYTVEKADQETEQ
jgi:hypothetical protein